MNQRAVRLVTSALAGAALTYLYLAFLTLFLSNAGLQVTTPVQVIILATQLIRLELLLVVPKLRSVKPEIAWITFSLETFVIVGLAGAYLLTFDHFYTRAIIDIFTFWPLALFVVSSPYVIFRFAISMARSLSLLKVFVSAVLEFSFLNYLVGLLISSGGTIKAPADFLRLMAANFRGPLAATKPLAQPDSVVVIPASLLYIALIVYAALAGRPNSRFELPIALVLPLVSTLLLLGWISLAGEYLPNTIFSLTAPTLAVTLFLWWSSRAR